MRGNKKLFLSAVSSEFVSYRNLLATDLKRPDLDVAVQEDFGVTGGTTLGKLDTYLRHCDAVIHLIGKAARRHAGRTRGGRAARRVSRFGRALAAARGGPPQARAAVLLHPMGSVSGDLSPAPTLCL